ncbi:MAG: acyl-[Eubacterium sp.]|nr:acyl-[acyl-carrier-protein] thioesterase [Eubacterium sp.]
MYTFHERIRYTELDENRNLSLVSIINFMQDCCIYEAEDGGVGIDWLKEHTTAWMLISWQVKILRRPVFCEHVKITTWACGFRHFLGQRNFTIENEETGELLIYAYSEWAYVNTETGKPERTIPQKELDVYGIREPLDMTFEKGRIPVPEEMTAKPSITVTELMLDTNHHVNNGQYVAMACSIPPQGTADFTDFRCDVRQQSRLGDIIFPFISEKDGITTVVLNDPEGKPKLVARFS